MLDMGLVAAGACVNGARLGECGHMTEAGYSMLICGCRKEKKSLLCVPQYMPVV